ncbi:MAG: hypothetical protein ACOVQU_14380, partial [Exiguobacterium acetylicum]
TLIKVTCPSPLARRTSTAWNHGDSSFGDLVEFQLLCVAVMDPMVEHLRDHWTLKRTLLRDVKA